MVNPGTNPSAIRITTRSAYSMLYGRYCILIIPEAIDSLDVSAIMFSIEFIAIVFIVIY